MQLEIKNLSFSYHKHKVLEEVSFSAQEGDFICVLGENGAGKSTLLSCICRLLKAKDGDVLIDNRAVSMYGNKEFARIVSFVPQNYNPVYECTVTDFLFMGRNPYKKLFHDLSSNDKKVVSEMLTSFSMEEFAHRSMSQLSGGERKKILLMRALVQEPDIIVLDEPTNQLDFGMRVQFMNILKRLADDGKIIIMTTHLPDDAINYSSKTVVVSGKRAAVYTKDELKTDVLEKLYSLKLEMLHGKTIDKMACIASE